MCDCAAPRRPPRSGGAARQRWPASLGRGRRGRPILVAPVRRADVADRAVGDRGRAIEGRGGIGVGLTRVDLVLVVGHPEASHLQPGTALRYLRPVPVWGQDGTAVDWWGQGGGPVGSGWDALSWCRSARDGRRRGGQDQRGDEGKDDDDQDDLHPREASQAVHPLMLAVEAARGRLAPPPGFEPGTFRLEGGCSVH